MDRRQMLGAVSMVGVGAALGVPAAVTAADLPPPRRREVIRSKDGQPLTYTRYGDRGSPVVICYGAFTVADDWERFAVDLARTHTVYLYDRRGHGRSPDVGKPYTLDTELDDLAVMAAVAGKETAILGHSFGGGCAIAYALRDRFKGRLILFEPVHSISQPIGGANLIKLRKLVAEGDLQAATDFAMVNIVRAPPPAVAAFHQLPIWQQMVQQVKAFPNEVQLLDSLSWKAVQLQPLQSQVVLLLGSQSVAALGPATDNGFKSTVADLIDRIPDTALLPIPGYGHTAYMEAPAVLSAVVERALMLTI